MSDKPIPERWREVIELSQLSPNHRNWHDDLRHCAQELHAAEAERDAAKKELAEQNAFYRGQSTLVGRISDELEALQVQNGELREVLEKIQMMPRYSMPEIREIIDAALAAVREGKR
jgi:predicted  nucleic acid-binding Zn-ribbon protein